MLISVHVPSTRLLGLCWCIPCLNISKSSKKSLFNIVSFSGMFSLTYLLRIFCLILYCIVLKSLFLAYGWLWAAILLSNFRLEMLVCSFWLRDKSGRYMNMYSTHDYVIVFVGGGMPDILLTQSRIYGIKWVFKNSSPFLLSSIGIHYLLNNGMLCAIHSTLLLWCGISPLCSWRLTVVWIHCCSCHN